MIEEYKAFLKSEGVFYQLSGKDRKLDHPVVNVTWKDAAAYCSWLNGVLEGELPFDLLLRLPTEAEWEKAARGKLHFIYPWGNDFEKNRNNSAGELEEYTSAVEAYSPQGDSAYGCADMSGNVWEWTHSLSRTYPYNAADGREQENHDENHVTRGGCFASGPSARCASRDDGSKKGSFSTGFRAAVSTVLS